MLLKILGIYILVMNLIGFFSMMRDKRRAIRHKSRTPEKRLLTYAALGGSIGAIAGMYTFRHKTLHRKFTLGLPAILILQLCLTAGIIILLQKYAGMA